jgi:hypothetical protein
MKEMNEQGFLSDKFDDWSGEPIPNGWGEIEKNLRKDKKRRPFFWWLFPSVILFGALSYVAVDKLNSTSTSEEKIVSTVTSDSPAEAGNNIDKNKLQANDFQSDPAVANVPENQNSGPNSIQASTATSSSDEVMPASRTNSDRGFEKNQSGNGKRSVSGSVVISSSDVTRHSGENPQSDVQPHSSNVKGSSIIFSKSRTRRKSARNRRPSDGPQYAAIDSERSQNSGQNNTASNHDAVANFQVKSNKSGAGETHNEGNSGDPKVAANQGYAQATDVPYLEIKNATFPTLQVPEIVPVLPLQELTQVPFLTLEKPLAARKIQFYAGIQTGIGQNTIELRQSMTEQQVKITNANSIQTYFLQLSCGMHYQLSSWLKAFTGLQVGMINQNIRYSTKSKSPETFSMVAHDSLNYAMTPHWTEKSETRSQQAVYANAEIGLKPLFFPVRNSGPFASVTLWTRISEKHSTDVPGSSPFIPVSSSLSLGYRLGYQHEIRKNILIEAYLSSFPSGIFAGTKGVSVSPRLVGFGCFYSF